MPHSRRVQWHPLVLLLALLAPMGLLACQPFGPPAEAARPSPTTRPTPVATPSGTPDTRPIEPPVGLAPERTLAYISDRGGQVDLWLQDFASGRLWRLTNDTAAESFPVWSPDGAMLAYVVEDEHGLRNLWLLDLRSGARQQLTAEVLPFGVRRAAWLRGGRVLLYDTGKPFDRRPELRAVTLDGSSLAALLPDDGSVIYDWSTDGSQVVCAVGTPLGEPKLVVAEAVPGMRLHPEPAAPVVFGVELSPDGRYTTYSAPPLSDNQIAWIFDLATGRKWALNEKLENRRYDHDFAWAPDSSRLVFVHGVGGVTEGQGRLKPSSDQAAVSDAQAGLYIIGRDGGGRERLTIGSFDAAPHWSPDGRWIAYLSDGRVSSTSDIWLIAATATVTASGDYHRLINLTASNSNNWSPTWMPLPGEGASAR